MKTRKVPKLKGRPKTETETETSSPCLVLYEETVVLAILPLNP